MEAAAVRPSVQVGGPSSGQRASDPGPPSQQSQPPPPPTIAYQQRITSGASPIHRPVDTPQPYTKVGIGPPPSQQPSSRSATSPLSPPRPGGAVNHTAYPRFADVTANSLRYVQGSQYGVGQVQQFRESPYARISQVPAPIQEYHRAGGQPVATGNSSMSMVSAGSASAMETGPQGHSSGRQRISLIATPQHASEYMSNTRPPPQAPPDPGGQPFKKIRVGETNHPPAQQLKVDTREHRPATTEAYHPQVEAISPTLPNDTVEERRPTKDDLLNQINKVDKEITKAENAKSILKNKEKALEEASAKPAKEPEPSEAPPKHRSLAQKIYAENRKRAQEEHAVLAPFCPQNELPLYNQPSDVEILQEIIQRHHQSIKSRLMLHLRRVKSERAARNTAFVEKYAQLSQEWQKRVEKIESSAKRKAKDAKSREFFEKVFTELRKQREDKERFNRVGSRIKSEADLEEIMDGLQEQAMEDKKMRSYAVIPPPMYDARQRRCVYSNENGYLEDMVADYRESQNLNMWTAGEKEIFKEKFLQHPKNFGAIAASLDRKSAQDCVRYYYLSKKTENYKQLLRKSRQRTRSSRNPQKSQQAQAQCIVDSLTTGVTTRLQREQQQKTGGRDRAAQSTALGTAVGAGGAAVTSSSTSTSTTPSGVVTTLTGNSSTTAGTSTPCSTTSVPSPTSGGLTVNSGNSSVTTVTSASTTVTTSSSSGVISNSKNMGSAGIGTFGTSGGVETTTSQSGSGAGASGSVDTNKEQPAPSVNSTESTTNFEQQSSSSEGTFTASSSDSANLSVTSTSVTSGNSNVNCNTVLNAGVEVVTEVSSTATTTGNVNSLTSTTTTVPTFNGLKTELVITNAVANINDGKSLCNDKERKSPAVTVLGGDEKCNLNSLGVRPRPSSADSCEASEPKKTRLDSDSSSNQTSMLANNEKTPDMNTVDSKDKFHPCFVCKTESCPRTRPLKKGRGQQYGIPDDTIPAGARVCNSCQCKSVRNRYPNCPLPTCPNSKDRAKRLHNIPSRLYELAPEIRDPILQEFQIPPNATRCCSACLMRIRRKLDPHSTLTDDERRTMLTDGDESDLSTSSCDERDAASSDTASAESPNNPLRPSISQKDDSQASDPTIVPLSRKTSSFEDDRLIPPLGQAPRKIRPTEEYDSSATETADEENENSPANRQSPKSILHANPATMSMVPPSSLQNGPQREQPSEQQTNVQEIMYQFIERSVKTVTPLKPSSLSIPKQPGSNDNRDVAFVREYRNDIPPKPITTSVSTPASMQPAQQVTQQISQSRQLQPQSQSVGGTPTESLATLSVVNSQSHIPQQIISHQHGITATITPVKAPMQQQQQQQQQPQPPQSQLQPPCGVITHEITKEDIMYSNRNEPEPQTLDLSIKKTSTRDSISVHTPVSHAKVQQQQPQHSTIAMYRNDQPNSQPQHQPQNSAYLTYHHQVDMNRPTKSPSIYVSQVPASLSQQGVRTQPVPPPQTTMSIQHQQQQQMQGKQKVAPKLSPKIHQQSPSPSQMHGSGPKGSITHGTPVNSQQQQMLIQTAAALSPRYEGLPRQTPPGAADGNKLGSITQGTPVHHIQDKQRAYFEFKNNRQSPAQQGPPPSSVQPQMLPQPPQQSSPQTQSFMSSPYVRQSYGSFDQTRQIVMHDYITSQQMQGPHCRQGRNEKESQSPRTSMAYYADKDRARPEYLSRTSPAEHINSTPSPHRTPPPQRQGVIQRHNTGGSKPPSPSPNRHPIMSHYPSAGHEAFSSFVEVAVQQPQLPVPQKEEKRAVLMPVGEHQVPSPHYDIRYQMTPEQQMQIHHHQQQQQQQHLRQQQAAVDMQRRIHAQQERDHRERQERENVERQNQERLQAERDRIDRERERERERERIRIAEEQEREERRRETVRAMPSGAPYMRNKMMPNVNRGLPERDREAIRRTQTARQPSEVTPAAIIDAIIQNSIKGTSEPLSRRDVPGRSQQFYATREQPHPSSISISENNGKSNSPNVINIELDGDRGRKQEIGTITIGELTDSIIAKDYGPSAVLSRAPTYMIPPMQDSIVTTDQWKYRRMHQKEAEQAAAAAAANAAAAERNKVASHGRSGTPDERQIIRMAQPPSPRNKFTVLPQGHFYSSVHGVQAPVGNVSTMDRRIGAAAQSHQFELDCYVKSRIKEVMRTEDERRPEDAHLHGHHTQQDVLRQGGPYGKEMDGRPNSGSGTGGKSTPVSYEDERRSMSNSGGGVPMNASNSDPSHGPLSYPPPQSQQPPPATTFASKTCAYPYNILDVSGPPQVSSKQVDIGGPPPPPQQTIAAEPKPLLQPHYEALSDED